MIVVLISTESRDGMDVEDHQRTSAHMREIVAGIPGFISYNNYEGENGEGLTVARFESEEALRMWRENLEHRIAQDKGRTAYYESYWVQVCTTIREYRFTRGGEYESQLGPMFAEASEVTPQKQG